MAKTRAQKQKDYTERLKTKDRAANLESEQNQKKEKLQQLKKDEAAYNLHLQKDRLRKAVKKVFIQFISSKQATKQVACLMRFNQLILQIFMSIVICHKRLSYCKFF